MNRRKAIRRLFWIGGGTLLAFSGYELYRLRKAPDLDYLEHRKELLADLADTILPPTESPGAKEASVQDFIVLMIRDCSSLSTQNKFIDGLKELERYCLSEYNKPFVRCSPEEKTLVLTYFEKQGNTGTGIVSKVEKRYFGKPFFVSLREYVVMGYCTSEIGAKQGLAYQFIPGKYIGCVTMQHHQKTWATK